MNVLVPLAEGFEEIEAMTVVDVLRRAGIKVITSGLPGTIVQGSRNVKVIADTKLEDVVEKDYDALVLVGGSPGYTNLSKSKKVMKIIGEYHRDGKIVAAICGAPTVLAEAGILTNIRATVYPGLEKYLPKPRSERVLAEGNVITSQGPGPSMEFALALVEHLAGKETMKNVKEQLLFRC
jgi:4-methyl-5(b-hydroxyethyl)-thiazole monophosphate biosynthesis